MPIKALMSAMHTPVYNHRLRVLLDAIIPHLREGDSVVDIGCGNGTLAAAIAADPRTPANVTVRGLERYPRGGEPVEVIPYDGEQMPFDDRAVDVVSGADVLHHEPNPHHLADECARVAGRLLIVKDHQVKGLLAQQRISLLDWAANAPYGVPCLYRYLTPDEWVGFRERLSMTPAEVKDGMKIYPLPFEPFLGGSLHYMAFLTHDGSAQQSDQSGAPA